MKELFGEKLFENPKDHEVLARLIRYCTDKSDNVLDFFAGSGTTAQAVIELNELDGGNRNFLLVQLPEPTDRRDYQTIAEIAKERIRRVGKKIKAQKDGELALQVDRKLDVGFKAFALDRSNFKVWEGDATVDEELGRQIEMHIEHVSKGSSPEDVLYELLLKAGFQLTTKVKQLVVAGKPVFSVEDGALLICLEKEITPELIDALADANPLQVICLDEGFKGNDQLKANAVQTFRARAEAEESEIVFKTV
jgi:adenine-specific DNA-methyltransferase